jgi:hypothetical protein
MNEPNEQLKRPLTPDEETERRLREMQSDAQEVADFRLDQAQSRNAEAAEKSLSSGDQAPEARSAPKITPAELQETPVLENIKDLNDSLGSGVEILLEKKATGRIDLKPDQTVEEIAQLLSMSKEG